jgi:hypothetical protein
MCSTDVRHPPCCPQLYTHEVPAEASQSDLMHMAAAADKFELRRVSAACIAKLAQLPADELDWDTVVWAFSPPDGIAALDSCGTLQQQASGQLQHVLGDLEVALQDAATCQRLVQLPHAGLLALLRDPGTRVAAEGTAVAAVALWVAVQERMGASLTLEQRRELASHIRMVQLPFTYLGTVLPHIEWLQGVITAQHIVLVTAAKGMPAGYAQHLVRLGIITDGADRAEWREWLGSARPQSSRQGVSVSVAVPATELNERGTHGTSEAWESPEPVLFGGYELGVCVELNMDRTFGASMLLHAIGSAPANPGLSNPAVAWEGDLACVVDGNVSCRRCIKGVWQIGTGLPNFFRHRVDMSAGWQPERLAPFLHDGKLTIELRVSQLLP